MACLTISELTTIIIILIPALFALWQLWEIKKANKAVAFRNYYEYMQREHVRKARGILEVRNFII